MTGPVEIGAVATGPGEIVVAGVGNVLRADDGFGPAVVRDLAADPPAGVRLVDAGIATIGLAFDVAEGVALLVAVDARDGGDPPGTLTVVDLDAPTGSPGTVGSPGTAGSPGDPGGHGIGLDEVLALARVLGPGPARTVLVGCQPARLDEAMELSAAVAAAVGPAATLVRRQIAGIGRVEGVGSR